MFTSKTAAAVVLIAALGCAIGAGPVIADTRSVKLHELADQVHGITGNDYACTRVVNDLSAEILVTTKRAQRLAERTVRRRSVRGVVVKRVSPRLSLHRRYVVAEILMRGLPTNSGALRIFPPLSDVLPVITGSAYLCQPVTIEENTSDPELVSWVDRAVARYGSDRIIRLHYQ